MTFNPTVQQLIDDDYDYDSSQCEINYGSGASPEPGPLNLGGAHNFTEIIFVHTKYIEDKDSSLISIHILRFVF